MLITIIRTFLLFSIIILSVRIMGKRQIGEMQASELVVTLLISNIAAIPMQEVGIPLLSGIVPILTLVVLEVVVSTIMLKSSRLRHIINGKPIVIIAKGKIDQQAMHDVRFSVEDLFEELRKNGVFDFTAVEYAILEPDGVLSVLERSCARPPTCDELKITAPSSDFHAVVISDGIIEDNSLKILGWDKPQFEAFLLRKKIAAEDVFIMTAQDRDNYTIVRKEKKYGKN